jgi:hypothetical protein
MKLIPLYKKDKIINYALVDDKDFNWLNQHKWTISISGKRNSKNKIKKYAITILHKNGWHKKMLMHRLIYEKYNLVPEKYLLDHKDGNGFNNQKENLRICTTSQNMQNKMKSELALTSQYKGVYFCPSNKLWRSRIKSNYKEIVIGHFKEEKDAAIAYDIKAKELFGEFSRCNFKDGEIDNKYIEDITKRINRNKSVVDTTSKYMGVFKTSKYYVAQCKTRKDGKILRWVIGYFNDESDAALARDYYILHLYPEKYQNKINFPNASKEDYQRIRDILLDKRRDKNLPFIDKLC